MPQKFDFSGWATKNDIKCSDGRTIRRDAFKDQDGMIVPLVWNHMHNEPDNVLGHALLQNRPEGVYAYGKFNDTESGQNAKLLVNHGDIVSLSIYANHLKQNGKDVVHGAIREVSLVLAGANPGAQIDNIISHGETDDESAVIAFIGKDFSESFEHTLEFEEDEEKPVEEAKEESIEVALEEPAEPEDVEHADKEAEEPAEEKEEEIKGANEMADNKEKTVQDVIDTMTEEQKTVMYALIGQALEDAKNNEVEDEDMKHNVFDNDTNQNTLSHADMDEIMKNAKRVGSLKDAFEAYVNENFLQHDDDEDPYADVDYGMEHINYLFPDAQLVGDRPQVVKRDDAWVSKFLNGATHTPFSRVKSVYADITEDDARAKGYIKGTEKKNEVFPLFKRVTTPTTVYKKQTLDRDDVVDLTFDIIPWLKAEMRAMLNEEIARAGLLGDGRDPSSDDKISEANIRPVYKDTTNDVYAIKVAVAPGEDEDASAKAFIKAAIKARKDFRGTGKPTLFCTTDLLTNMLLLEDNMGRQLFDSESALATKLRVAEIVEVPPMDNVSRDEGGFSYKLAGIIVNPKDYTYGADKGGNVAMFDDFDIDFNRQKYLIETRCSGALTTPKSAIVLEFKEEGEASV